MPTNPSIASELFEEGMKYNYAQSKSPAATTLARAAFNQAAALGHNEASKALANMEFYGEGGDKNKERAILRLWSVFTNGDAGALEDLADMLSSYAEGLESQEKRKTIQASEDIENLGKLMIRIIPFIKAIAKKMPN